MKAHADGLGAANVETLAAFQRLNALSEAEAGAWLERCLGARRWVESMLRARPFASAVELHQAAAQASAALTEQDLLEAFAHHPAIGANLDELRRKFASTSALSAAEQAGVSQASDATLQQLRTENENYRQRFGFVFLVCATGKSAEEMLQLLRARVHNSRERELEIAKGELAKIAQIRLEKL